MALTLVLSVGLNPELLCSRNQMLEDAGYTVVRAFTLKAAIDCFQILDFDLILLCHSIPTTEKNRLISWIRAFGSRIPVLSVSERPYKDDDLADVTTGSSTDEMLAAMQRTRDKTAIHAKFETTRSPIKKPAGSSDGSNGITRAAKRQFVRLAHTG